MKKNILFMIFTIFFFAKNVFASGYYTCGIPPLRPIGCLHCERICVCDLNNNCFWVFVKK